MSLMEGTIGTPAFNSLVDRAQEHKILSQHFRAILLTTVRRESPKAHPFAIGLLMELTHLKVPVFVDTQCRFVMTLHQKPGYAVDGLHKRFDGYVLGVRNDTMPIMPVDQLETSLCLQIDKARRRLRKALDPWYMHPLPHQYLMARYPSRAFWDEYWSLLVRLFPLSSNLKNIEKAPTPGV